MKKSKNEHEKAIFKVKNAKLTSKLKRSKCVHKILLPMVSAADVPIPSPMHYHNYSGFKMTN